MSPLSILILFVRVLSLFYLVWLKFVCFVCPFGNKFLDLLVFSIAFLFSIPSWFIRWLVRNPLIAL